MTTSATLDPLRILPADGERRLCSAISDTPGRVSASENGLAPSTRPSSALSRSLSGTSLRRRFTSSRVSSTMRSSTLTRSSPSREGLVALGCAWPCLPRQLLRQVHECVQRGGRPAVVDGGLSGAHAGFQGLHGP